MAETTHTPGSWHISGNTAWADSCKDRGAVFCCTLVTGTHVPADQNTVNAAYIVRACNSFPDLLAACEEFSEAMRFSEPPNMLWLIEALHKADAAIKKARPAPTQESHDANHRTTD